MAKLFQFDLVSPEKSLMSLEVSEVNIPGAEGDFSSLINHAPIITTLRPGFVNVSSPSGDVKYFVTGGFAEVSSEATSVLAEKAYLESDLTRDIADELITKGQKRSTVAQLVKKLEETGAIEYSIVVAAALLSSLEFTDVSREDRSLLSANNASTLVIDGSKC